MTQPNAIAHDITASGGSYRLTLEGVSEPATLDYRQLAVDRIAAMHTFVPDAMRGKKIAQQLVERLVADARAQGWRIEPRCSYVRALAERTPEWADLFV